MPANSRWDLIRGLKGSFSTTPQKHMGCGDINLSSRWRRGCLATWWRTLWARRIGGGWEGLVAGPDLLEEKKKITCFCRESNHESSSVQALLLYRLSYSDCWDKNRKGTIRIMKGRIQKKCIMKKERTKEWKERTRLKRVLSCWR